MRSSHVQAGFGLVEVIIGSAIIITITLGSIAAISFYIKIGLAQTERVQASYLVEEGLEAARFIRDSGYAASIVPLSSTTNYYLATSTSGWATSTTPVIVDGFTRTVQFGQAWRRDSDKDLVASTSPDAKTVDIDTRKVLVKVSWQAGSTTASTSATTYLTNVFND